MLGEIIGTEAGKRFGQLYAENSYICGREKDQNGIQEQISKE